MSISSLFSESSGVPLAEGGLYCIRCERGYQILKILKIDEHGVHVRVYSNVFDPMPEQVDEHSLYLAGVNREPHDQLGLGHLALSSGTFADWNAVFLQQSTVRKEELEGYEIWLEGQGGYF